jgi:hypothetical protein
VSVHAIGGVSQVEATYKGSPGQGRVQAAQPGAAVAWRGTGRQDSRHRARWSGVPMAIGARNKGGGVSKGLT